MSQKWYRKAPVSSKKIDPKVGATREMAISGEDTGLIKCQTAQFHLHQEDLKAFKEWASSKN